MVIYFLPLRGVEQNKNTLNLEKKTVNISMQPARQRVTGGGFTSTLCSLLFQQDVDVEVQPPSQTHDMTHHTDIQLSKNLPKTYCSNTEKRECKKRFKSTSNNLT